MLYYPKKVLEAKLITRDVSIITFWLGMLMLIPMAIAIISGEPFWYVYLPLILITSGLSYLFMKRIKHKAAPFTQTTLVTLAVMWIVFSIVGSYPFIAVAGMDPLDALFESVSSISTVGITAVPIPELLPNSVMFWRLMLCWLGGIGITAFAFYSILQSESVARIVIGEGYERLKPSLVNSGREIFKIYSFWTIVGIIMLLVIGIPFVDSLSLSVNAISTTGTDIHSGGWLYYQKHYPQAFSIMPTIVAFLMLMGSISFVAHYRVLKSKRILMYFKDSETRAFLIILIIGVALVAGYAAMKGLDPVPLAYEAYSTSTTGGFEILPFEMLNVSGSIMAGLIILALIGGASNSPAGGLKVRRVAILLKYIGWRASQEISPKGSVSHFKYGGETVSTDQIAEIAVYAFIYGIAIILVAGFLIALGYDSVSSVFTVAGAQSGSTSSMQAFDLMWPAKAALIGTMLLGRLEFLPLFALAAYALHRR